MRASMRIAALLAACVAAVGHAQTLLDTTLTLGKKPAPVILDFTAPAGNYRITLTDFGTPSGPVRMARVDAAVLRGSSLVTSLNVTSANSSGTATKSFAATAGAHRLVLIGQPASPAVVGSAGVRIDDPVSGAVLLDTVKVFTVPPAPTASPADFEHQIAVAGGTYTLEITDFGVAQPLAAFNALAVRRSDGQLFPVAGSEQPVQLTAGAADTFEIFVHAELASAAKRGLVGVSLRDAGSGAVIAAQVDQVGEWPYTYTFDVAAATTLTASLTDLGFPFPLAALGAEVVRDGRRAGAHLVGSGSASFAAVPGTYTAYVDASPAAGGPGGFGLTIAPPAPAAKLVEKVTTVSAPGPVTDIAAIDTGFDIATAGSYTLTLTDFGIGGFFDPFTSITLALARDSAIVGTLSAAGALTFTATPGHYDLAIVADPAGSAGEGLLGIRVVGSGNTIVFDQTQAAGTDFITATVTVTTAQSVDVKLADLAFPAAFDAVKLAVTRGSERVGQIYGAGTFSFQATPGVYIVNLLATPSATFGYGTFGLTAGATPPVPGVTLGASAQSVTAGGSVTLSWSATNATTCTASGGWSGAQPTTGTFVATQLNAKTTFTLSCDGPGGNQSASVTVDVTAQERSGGGGAIDAWLLALLGGALLVARRRSHTGAAPT
jgi:hypothetical protein